MSGKTFLQDGTIRIQILEPQIITSFSALSELENTFGISNSIAQHPYSPLEIVYQNGKQETKQLIFVAPDLSGMIHNVPYGVWVNIPMSDVMLSLAISCPPASVPNEAEEHVITEEIPSMWAGEMANLVDFGCWIIGPVTSMATGIPLTSPLASLIGNRVKKAIDGQIPKPARTTKAEVREKILNLIAKRTGQLKANVVGGLLLNSDEILVMGVQLDKYPITITLPEGVSLYISGSISDNTLTTCQALSARWISKEALVATYLPASGRVMVHKEGKQHPQNIPHRLRGVSTYRFVDLSSVIQSETSGS